MQVIFTATLGRNGSQNLVDLFNRVGIDCVAEHEPPDLPLRQLGYLPFFRNRGWLGPGSRTAMIGRNFQRRFLAPDEMVGRGRALEWVARGDAVRLADLAQRRVRRLHKFARRGYRNYLEAGPYFLRTYGEETWRLLPGLGLIKLTRQPLANAKSFVNRQKVIWQNALPPDSPGNILRIDGWERLSKLQLYLYLWCETELKFAAFVERHAVTRVFRLDTPDLSDRARIEEMFRYFGIQHRPLADLAPTNTAATHGKDATIITDEDVRAYYEFLNLVPANLLERIEYLKKYAPKAG